MNWSTHQQALLREMGLRIWAAPTTTRSSAEAAPRTAEEAPGAASPSLPLSVTPPSVQPAIGSNTSAALPPRPIARPVYRPEDRADTRPDARAAVEQAVALTGGATVASLGWQDLAATVADCRACSLCEGRTQTVFGVGHRSAHWMLVGEAPGEQEDKQGEPFVGKAGHMLDNMLRAVGLTRGEADAPTQVYIANVLKCRPPQNRNPLPEEVARCEPYLRRQVALVQPRLILAMGRFAVQSILASQEPIGRLRGRIHQYEGVPVVVTYHPAYLLRNPIDKARAWEDLCLARELIQRPDAGPH